MYPKSAPQRYRPTSAEPKQASKASSRRSLSGARRRFGDLIGNVGTKLAPLLAGGWEWVSSAVRKGAARTLSELSWTMWFTKRKQL